MGASGQAHRPMLHLGSDFMILFKSALALTALFSALCPAFASDPSASPWTTGTNAATRLLAGSRAAADGTVQPIAGVEIRLADGWKTYWRHPGDAGGIPPSFDWSASDNVAGVRVLFPAPERFADASGETIGYKKQVVMPVEVTPRNSALPVVLRVSAEYGVCREICIPAEAKLEVTIPPSSLPQMPPQLSAALARVPRTQAMRRPTDPSLKSATASLNGANPRLVFEIAGDDVGADLFVEAPDGIMLPLPRRAGARQPGVVSYEIAVNMPEDAKALPGKTLILTMVSAKGSAEARWTVK